jgi:hypothetical protein
VIGNSKNDLSDFPADSYREVQIHGRSAEKRRDKVQEFTPPFFPAHPSLPKGGSKPSQARGKFVHFSPYGGNPYAFQKGRQIFLKKWLDFTRSRNVEAAKRNKKRKGGMPGREKNKAENK